MWVAAAALLAAPALAQNVKVEFAASDDSDEFRERAWALGYVSRGGWGLRARHLDFRAPGWQRLGQAVEVGYEGALAGGQGLARLGAASVAGREHAVGLLEWQRALGADLTLGVSVERDLVASERAIDAGVVHTALAVTGDYQFNERFNVGWMAGSTHFSNDNDRPIARTRWNCLLHEPWGLNAYLKTRNYRNSNPGRPEYYSPSRLDEASVGISARTRLSTSVVLSLSGDVGRQSTTDARERIWSSALALSSPPRATGLVWSARWSVSNTATNATSAGGYRYTALQLQVTAPL